MQVTITFNADKGNGDTMDDLIDFYKDIISKEDSTASSIRVEVNNL